MPYQWLTFFLEDDAELADIAERYGSGKLQTGEVKARLIKCLQDFVKDFQSRRSKVTDEDVKKFMSVRKIDAVPRAWAGVTGAAAASSGPSAAPGSLTLYSDITDFGSASVKIVADLCGIPLSNKPLKDCPQKGKDPVLMVDGKAIVSAPAIASYLARLSSDKDQLLGASPFEEAKINQIVAVSTSTILPAVKTLESIAYGT